MEVLHEEKGRQGSFYVLNNDHKAAEMTYIWAGQDRIIIDHTEVGDELRGQGVGKSMVIMAVDYARSKSISVVPLCPFARSVFDKNPELKDVL